MQALLTDMSPEGPGPWTQREYKAWKQGLYVEGKHHVYCYSLEGLPSATLVQLNLVELFHLLVFLSVSIHNTSVAELGYETVELFDLLVFLSVSIRNTSAAELDYEPFELFSS